jgi:endonuclease I
MLLPLPVFPKLLIMKKPALLLAVLLFFICVSHAQIPQGYYDPANGLYGTQLKAALHNIIKGHTSVSYDALWYYFQSTDKKSDNSVWDMYSDNPNGTPPYVYHYTADQCGVYHTEGDCYNREHSWPKSWFGGEVEPMYTDMFHLYPVDGYVNGMRNNNAYGEVNSASWTSENGGKLGPCVTPGYSGTVFEPIDEYKGDLARTYFYMSVRYYTEDNGWPGSEATTGSQLKPWALALMLQWDNQDPVSQKETERNNAVYLIQNNRNPFIDHPEFAQEIWGAHAGIGSTETGTGKLVIHPNPSHNLCYLVLPGKFSENECTLTTTDITGCLENIHYTFEGNRISADISSLPAGIYLSTVTIPGKGTYTGKIVKN